METYLASSEIKKIFMRSDPVITYNHMEDDEAVRQKRVSSKTMRTKTFEVVAFAAEEAVVLMLLGVLFFLW